MSLNLNPRLLALALVATTTIGVGGLAMTGTAQAQQNDPNCTFRCDDDDDRGRRGKDDDDDDCYGVQCNNRPDPDPVCIAAPCTPGKTPGDKYAECLIDVGSVRKVYAWQLGRIRGEDNVAIATVCDGGRLRDQQQGSESLHAAIAENPRMVQLLKQRGYRPSQVVGLKFGPTDAVLYVYKR